MGLERELDCSSAALVSCSISVRCGLCDRGIRRSWVDRWKNAFESQACALTASIPVS